MADEKQLECGECKEKIGDDEPVYSNEQLHFEAGDGEGEKTIPFCSEFCRQKYFDYFNQQPCKGKDWE